MAIADGNRREALVVAVLRDAGAAGLAELSARRQGVAWRQEITLSRTADHRAVDGAPAAGSSPP